MHSNKPVDLKNLSNTNQQDKKKANLFVKAPKPVVTTVKP